MDLLEITVILKFKILLTDFQRHLTENSRTNFQTSKWQLNTVNQHKSTQSAARSCYLPLSCSSQCVHATYLHYDSTVADLSRLLCLGLRCTCTFMTHLLHVVHYMLAALKTKYRLMWNDGNKTRRLSAHTHSIFYDRQRAREANREQEIVFCTHIKMISRYITKKRRERRNNDDDMTLVLTFN
jgi:hypothetical protein